MTWWQGVLVIVSCIIAGGAIGLVGGYAFLRWKNKYPHMSGIKLSLPRLKKTSPDSFDDDNEVVEEEPIPDTIDGIVNAGKPAPQNPTPATADVSTPGDALLADFMKSRNAVGTHADENRLVYLKEVEANLQIAINPNMEKLIAFQTAVWDNNHSAFSDLPANVKAELREAYTDIVMANTIVWLSTGVGRRSKSLDTSYLNLCTKIEQRLRIIIPLLKSNG